jgi:hypothetical protein
MPNVVYRSLSSLTPIELRYQYHTNEPLKSGYKQFLNGFSFYNLEGTQKYQDITLNKKSCVVLTSAINLQTFFDTSKKIQIGKLPQSVLLQPRQPTSPSIYYIKHDSDTNTFRLALTSASTFYVQPLSNTSNIKIYVDSKPLQVQNFYPYEVFLSNETIDENEQKYQKFEAIQHDNIIMFKTLTDSGYRYLALNSDNVLRATGLIFNNSVINDYIFSYIPVTTTEIERGFIPTNNWVTYYYDIESKANNKTVTVNKNFTNVVTNFLIDFPYTKAVETGIATINIANLKTGLTPTGGPAPVENSYDKQVSTTNIVNLLPTNEDIATNTVNLSPTDEDIASTPFTINQATQFNVTYNNKSLQGYYYIPTNVLSSTETILGFHGTSSSDSSNLSFAQNLLNTFVQTIGFQDKIVVSIAYPQENILFGDISVPETALLWLFNNGLLLNQLGPSININRIFLFGHSQGGYIVARLNTMYQTAGVIANAPGPIDILDRCSIEEQKPYDNRIRECRLLYDNYGTTTQAPQQYTARSLISFTTGLKSKMLLLQGRADKTYQLTQFANYVNLLNQCTNCAPFTVRYIENGKHNAWRDTQQGRDAIKNFITNN